MFQFFSYLKGILGSVTVQRLDGTQLELTNWAITGFPLQNSEPINNFIRESKESNDVSNHNGGFLFDGPNIFSGNFNVNEVKDTYLVTNGWGKGVAFINGFNIGRYWPLVGPQITLYVPKNILNQGENVLVLFELEKSAANNLIQFTDVPKLDG